VHASHPADALTRPASARTDALGAWDDLPVHQSPALLAAVEPALPGWSERFYFNVLRPTGEIAAVLGGGVYPVRGVVECYLCRLDGDVQRNLRAVGELPAPGREVASGPFSLRCDVPLRDWTVGIAADGVRFDGRFTGLNAPYLYEPVDVPASDPGGDFDLFRHFVAVGRWTLADGAGIDVSEELLGVRDRTWGVRTRRVRWHNWAVFHVGDVTVTLMHQELADGTVRHSEAGAVHADGRVQRFTITGHDLSYDRKDRQIVRGRWDLASEAGPLVLDFERVGTALRLAGAGYDDSQGGRAAGAVQRDEYDLADPEVARRTGRGTSDAGARVRLSGVVDGEGIGVVETALARDHVHYGSQIA
jgi:hypothetical protein